MKPATAFPFLKIAKDFDVDYGDVLLVADSCLHKKCSSAHVNPARDRLEAKVGPAVYDLDAAIWAAIDEFKIIQKEGWD